MRLEGTARHASTLRDYLQVVRRRLIIVLAVAVLGLAGGWLSAPGKSVGHVSYRATHTLIYEPHGSQSFNIAQFACEAFVSRRCSTMRLRGLRRMKRGCRCGSDGRKNTEYHCGYHEARNHC